MIPGVRDDVRELHGVHLVGVRIQRELAVVHTVGWELRIPFVVMEVECLEVEAGTYWLQVDHR